MLITAAIVVVTAGDETTRLKRELVTYDAMAGELELYVRIPSLSSLTDTEIWNADYGGVYHLKEDPAGTAPQAKDSTVKCGTRHL